MRLDAEMETAFEAGKADPHFSYRSEVFFDELDAWHTLHNARYALHVERADVAWYTDLTGRQYGPDSDSDQFIFVREFRIEYLMPFTGPGEMWVDLWSIRLGRTSSTYGFCCRSEDHDVVYSHGIRTLVKFDPVTRMATPWSEEMRESFSSLTALPQTALPVGA